MYYSDEANKAEIERQRKKRQRDRQRASVKQKCFGACAIYQLFYVIIYKNSEINHVLYHNLYFFSWNKKQICYLHLTVAGIQIS